MAGLDLVAVDETDDLGENEEADVVGVHGTDLVCWLEGMMLAKIW